MATKSKNSVQLVSEGLEKKLTSNLKNSPKAQPEIIVDVEDSKKEVVKEVVLEVPKEVAPAPSKTVRILLNTNHKCCIGGEWYSFVKGKHYNVPENVKDILMRANKLSPL